MTIEIDISDIRESVYQYTSRRARIICQKGDIPSGNDLEEEYTLGFESEIRESNVNPIEIDGKISVDTYNVPGIQIEDNKYYLTKIKYNIAELKQSFFNQAAGDIVVDSIVDEREVVLSIDIDKVLNACEIITANRAKYVALDNEFDRITITEHERELVTYYFNEACINLSLYIGSEYILENKGWGVKSVFGDSTLKNIENLMEKFIEFYILSDYYSIVNLENISKEYEIQLAGLTTLIKFIFQSYSSIDSYMSDSSSKVYECLYPLTKELPVNSFEVGNDEIIYTIENKYLPITGSSVINIWNMGQTAIINGMLYRLQATNKPDDAKVSFALHTDALTSIKKFIEKKAKYVDLFPLLLSQAAEKVRSKILAYNKCAKTLPYLFDTATGIISFKLFFPDTSFNTVDILSNAIKEYLYYDVLTEWYKTCKLSDEILTMTVLRDLRLDKLSNLLLVRNKPIVREYKQQF